MSTLNINLPHKRMKSSKDKEKLKSNMPPMIAEQ